MSSKYENTEDTVLIVEDTSENHEIIDTFLKDINVKLLTKFCGDRIVYILVDGRTILTSFVGLISWHGYK